MEANSRVNNKKLLIVQSHLKDKVAYKFILSYFHLIFFIKNLRLGFSMMSHGVMEVWQVLQYGHIYHSHNYTII